MPQAQDIADIIGRCFNDDTYSDLTIKCHGRSWKVHRVIVCSQSKVLHAACMTGFKESHIGIIDLDDNDPEPVEIMLKYFYTGKYNEPTTESKELRIQLRVQVLVYSLADKYDVPILMGLAEKRFKSTLSRGPTIEEYLTIVSDIYAMPTSIGPLRAITVEHARSKFRNMMQSADLEMLRTTLQDVPDFAFDVLQLFVKKPLRGYCSSCGPNQDAEALQARCINCGKGGISLSR